jgi:hypothetical protein
MADTKTAAEYEQEIAQLNRQLSELKTRNHELRIDYSILTEVQGLKTIYDNLAPIIRASVLTNAVKHAIKESNAQITFGSDTANPSLQTISGGNYYGKDNKLQDLNSFSRSSLEQLNILGTPKADSADDQDTQRDSSKNGKRNMLSTLANQALEALSQDPITIG